MREASFFHHHIQYFEVQVTGYLYGERAGIDFFGAWVEIRAFETILLKIY